MFKIVLVLLITLNVFANENTREIASEVRREIASIKGLRTLAVKLVDKGEYYAATPIIKEYLAQINNRTPDSLDDAIEKTIRKVGLKQFEVLSITKLSFFFSLFIQNYDEVGFWHNFDYLS